MKKMIFVFVALLFSNISIGWGAFFYADALEQAIVEEFPADLQSVVASEYEAQMNQDTGEIDANGMYNVCYAGGYDVSTFEGAEKCSNFVNKVQSGCAYLKGSSIKYYNNPQTIEQKIQKCVFDEAMKIVIKYEGGFQQTPSDEGNRILDEDGNVKYNPDGTPVLGATKYGITTRTSRLSVECIRKMTLDQAYGWYWTHHVYPYKYYKLPIPLMAGVVQLSVGGVGKVAKELREVVDAQYCGSDAVVIDDCILEAVDKYMEAHTVQDFYEDICERRAKKYKEGSKYKKRAIETKDLASAYEICRKLFVSDEESSVENAENNFIEDIVEEKIGDDSDNQNQSDETSKDGESGLL